MGPADSGRMVVIASASRIWFPRGGGAGDKEVQTVRRAMGVIAAVLMLMAIVGSPSQSEAQIGVCSLNGTYVVTALGEAAGFFEAIGSLIFDCNTATVGGFITIRHQGEDSTNFIPAGPYSVVDGLVNVSVPGIIELIGHVSLLGSGDLAHVFLFVAKLTDPQVLSGTAVLQSAALLQGPQGEPGATGPPGVTGVTGATGPPGSPGGSAINLLAGGTEADEEIDGTGGDIFFGAGKGTGSTTLDKNQTPMPTSNAKALRACIDDDPGAGESWVITVCVDDGISNTCDTSAAGLSCTIASGDPDLCCEDSGTSVTYSTLDKFSVRYRPSTTPLPATHTGWSVEIEP